MRTFLSMVVVVMASPLVAVAAPVVTVRVEPLGNPKLTARATRAVEDSLSEIRHCYARMLVTTPTLAGELRLRMHIDSQGSPEHVRQTKNTLHDPDLVSCVDGEVHQWSLAAAGLVAGKTMTVSFSFQPTAEGK